MSEAEAGWGTGAGGASGRGGGTGGLPEAQREVGWGSVLALCPTLVGMVWLISKLRWVWSSQPEMQFGWIVVMLVAYLVWENWEGRPGRVERMTVGNSVVAFGSVAWLGMVQVYQAAFGTNAASLCGHALGVVMLGLANLHYVWGWRGIRRFGFPLVFLFVAVPMPSAIQNPVTGFLQRLVTSVNVEVLNLSGIPAERVGSLIRLPGGTVGVNEACSGIRSLQSAVMATLFIGYLSLRSGFLRVLLFGGGLMVAVLGNLLRSLYLSFTASSRGVGAVNEVHDAAGWSILLFTAVGVAVLAWGLARVEVAARRTRAVVDRDAVPRTP